MNVALQKLSDQVSAGFDLLRKDLANIELDDIMSSLQALNFAYQEMQNVTLLEEKVPAELKKLYTDRYRDACNRPHFTPEDIFRNLYGYACGNNKNRSCKEAEGYNTGECKFGVKKRQYILDILFDTAKGLPSSIGGVGEWIAETMILAQFHYSACLPADPTTCLDTFTDPIRKKIAADQVLAFQEVASNIEREVVCIQDVTFDEYLSGDQFFKNVAPNRKCFENGDGKEVNQCMATATQKALSEEFPSKEWTVVVYSKQNDDADLGTKNVVWKCNPARNPGLPDTQAGALRMGCISVGDVKFDGFDEQKPRYFHLMYRGVGEVARDYSISFDINGVTYVELTELYKIFGLVLNGMQGYCWFHPMDNSGIGDNNYLLDGADKEITARYFFSSRMLEKDEGYIAFFTKGIDIAHDAGNFMTKRGTILWGEEGIRGISMVNNCTENPSELLPFLDTSINMIF